jgi:very-short-patch-repair endonuclease
MSAREVDERIAAAAARQHGVVSCRQLLDVGLTPAAVGRRLRSGRMRALHRGVYLAIPFPLPRTREMAAVLAGAPGAVLSHVSAAALWGLRACSEASSPVDVTATGNRGRRPGIRLHRADRLADEDRAMQDGIPVTTPARTIVDLAAVLGTRELEGVVARAEREGLVGPEELWARLARSRGRPGRRALGAVLARPGGPALTRSEAEEKLLTLIRDARLQAPECNVGMGRYEVDFLWRSAGIAVEVDGFSYHSSRPRFEGDRRKDVELLAAGITVLRLTWRQITQEPLATAVQLGQALARAGNRR